jgi:catechol 2,3-dioxygenase-like lactoylglutathione lyase family enzyme
MTAAEMGGLFHIGIVVDDLAESMERYHRALGCEWATPEQASHTVRGPDGRIEEVEFSSTFSLAPPVHIQLMQANNRWYVPADGGARLHHLGFWVKDLAVASAQLEADGFPVYVTGGIPEGVEGFVHHADPGGGPFIELVDEGLARKAIQTWLEGGNFKISTSWVTLGGPSDSDG